MSLLMNELHCLSMFLVASSLSREVSNTPIASLASDQLSPSRLPRVAGVEYH